LIHQFLALNIGMVVVRHIF